MVLLDYCGLGLTGWGSPCTVGASSFGYVTLLLSVLRGLALGKNPVSGTPMLCYVVGFLYAAPSRKKPRVGDAFAIAYVVNYVTSSKNVTSYTRVPVA